MKMPFLKLVLLMLALACLAACSSSNNLQNPSSSSTTVKSSCNPSSAGCIQGQFVADEVVSGLSYTCTSTDQSLTVTSVTDASGFFTCPSGSTATFYIGTVVSNNQVILGSATINPQALPSGVNNTSVATETSGIVQVSPETLVLGSTSAVVAGDPTGSNTVINIVRFLKAIDDDGATWRDPNFSGFNPSNRILIDNNVSDQVIRLTTSVQPSAFEGADLSPALQAFIDSIPGKDHTVDVPPVSIAQQELVAFLDAAPAGVYVSSGLPCSSTDQGTTLGQEIYDEGMCNPSGVGSAPESGDLMLFVDRTGYGFGFGVTSNSNVISTSPTPFYIEGAVDGTPSDTNALTRPFSYENDSLSLAAESQATGGKQPMTWGGVLSGGAIASTSALFDLLYGTTLNNSSSSTLGVWTYGTPSNTSTYVSKGQFFMYDYKPTNPYLDSSIFGGLKFPINLQLTFEYPSSSTSSTTCVAVPDNPGYCYLSMAPPKFAGASSSYGGSPGTLQVSILQNGNIVTNLNQDCNQLLDPTAATLVDTSGGTEYRIGFVSTVTSGVMPSDSTKTTVNQLSLTMLFPQNGNVNLPPALQGVLLGVNSKYLLDLPVSGSNAFNVVADDQMVWYNYFDVISSAASAANAADGSGIVLIKKVTNSQCTSS